MRLTQVLRGPPVFRYWKHFGAGLQNRQPNFKYWRHAWISRIQRRVIPDHTIPCDKLPPGARVLNGEDLLMGHIDELPEQLLERKNNKSKVLYDHPWPFNVQLDPWLDQEPVYNYNIQTRFYTPQVDCQVLTNTIIESDALEARPPVEPTSEHVDDILRQFDWATRDDSILLSLPTDRSSAWPKMNRDPRRSYGITKERMEVNVMNAISSYAQTLLAKYYHEQGNQIKLEEVLNHRSLAYPHCVVPFERAGSDKKLNMDLFIDSMLIGKKPLPLINTLPADTRQREPVDIAPRTWRSLLPASRNYTPAWSFTLPQDARLHTIQISSRIKRKHMDKDEMLARSIVHAFALASQYARLQASSDTGNPSSLADGSQTGQTSNILQDPLSVRHVNNRDLLDQPIVLQTISYDKFVGSFHFLRYQLNTLKFDDQNPERVKNQAWHSGPISELNEALRYYLDFLTFDSSMVPQMRDDLEAARLRALQSAEPVEDTTAKSSPEALAEGY